MSRLKQVKVDNWGIYFLQRLKHFFNRTDYCDLTLQFQDNAQLKVHRLVLSACTEYFELLERTCEMYEDCLVMPEDLQADVVVPIVNFMYTGQLEFENSLLENLYQTSQIMNMPVLTKLLEAHRNQPEPPIAIHKYGSVKRSYSKSTENTKPSSSSTGSSSSNKRSFTKAFGKPNLKSYDEKRPHFSNKKIEILPNTSTHYVSSAIQRPSVKKHSHISAARPTRYELPEELDVDNIFDDSFSNISYNTGPLMVHPETTKKYASKSSGIFSSTKSSNDVECKKISRDIFDDISEDIQEDNTYSIPVNVCKDPNKLFDQIVVPNTDPLAVAPPKVTIETKDSKQAASIDHAKIISEVLKKYPHLVKSNKNIKLKILNPPSAVSKPQKKQRNQTMNMNQSEPVVKQEPVEFTYESDVLNSKEAARLIALGADNITGPWICLICGTPGKALHFTSYYNFRRHLVDVHGEKEVSKMCEYCGAKYLKRNYLLHHLYTKHGVEPPSTHHFPKCNMCSYIALNDSFLLKHKMNHAKDRTFKCIVCNTSFNTTSKLMEHMQSTGHKYSGDKKGNLQCVYCMKSFHRENNLYAHIMTNHKLEAKNDGIVEESDEEKDIPYIDIEVPKIKHEHKEPAESNYNLKQKPESNIQIISKKEEPAKQKILNTGYHIVKTQTPHEPENMYDVDPEEIVMIDNNEYVMRGNQLVPREKINEDYAQSDDKAILTPRTIDYSTVESTTSNDNILHEQKLLLKKDEVTNQPIQIVVSNEDEYKALMNANHSIIFEDGDANKTLTVLSTPETQTIHDTTLELESAHSNDVMIIPQNYAMAVSSSLPTSSSNIVVVYSPSVIGEQNKQYQIIAQPNIDAQFVESSAVIAPHFETIPTAPDLSSEVINTEVEESWQNEFEQNSDTTTGAASHIAIIEQTQIISAENDLNDLPEVTLSSNGNIVESEQMSVVLEEVTDNPDVDETPIIDDNSKDTDRSITEEIIDEAPVSENVVEVLNEPPTVVETDTANETEVIETFKDNVTVIQEHVIANTECQTDNVENLISTESNNEILHPDDVITTESNNDILDLNNKKEEEKQVEGHAVIEKVHLLASEWSDDEGETEGPNSKLNETSQDTENPGELEESIENIQQEMEKDFSDQVNNVHIEVANDTTDKNDNLQELDDSVKAMRPTSENEPQEKISSLLNDWEDNDSQGNSEEIGDGNEIESETVTETTCDTSEMAKATTATAEVTLEQPVIEPIKDDNIKKIVSDWDDEEEVKE